jgi:hypothetical protein
LALTGKAYEAAQIITSGISALRSTGSTLWMPLWMSHLARAYADLHQFSDASRCIGEVMTTIETTKERLYEVDVHRIAGEVALLGPEPDVAETQFEQAVSMRERNKQSPGSCVRR